MNQEWKRVSQRLFQCPRAALRCEQLLETQVKPLMLKKFQHISKEILLDCWSEVHVILMEQLKKGKSIAAPRAFLLTLLHRKLKDYWRSSYHRQRTEATAEQLEKAVENSYAFEHKDFLQRLFALAGLSPRNQAILLKQKEGYSDKELAAHFQLSLGSVKVLRAKSLRKLRSALKASEGRS